jgi:carbon monoxide dehydrogenase subunit G
MATTRIESKQVEIGKPAADLYAFLQDMNNFKQLLPQDKISDWQSDGVSCSFKVAGAATIGLMLDGGTPPGPVGGPARSVVRLKATDRSPFPFTLDVNLEEANGTTRLGQVFEAELNTFLKMMVERPLQNLFDHIADKMKAVHG